MFIFYWNIFCQVVLQKRVALIQCLRILPRPWIISTLLAFLFHLCQLVALITVSLITWPSFLIGHFYFFNVFFLSLIAFLELFLPIVYTGVFF